MDDSQLGEWIKLGAMGKQHSNLLKTVTQAEMGSLIPSGMAENILLACHVHLFQTSRMFSSNCNRED